MIFMFTKTTILIRVLLTFFGVWGIMFGYPWMVLASMTFLALRFRAWEVLALGASMDLLWLPEKFLYDPLPLFTLGALLLLWGLEPLRKELFI